MNTMNDEKVENSQEKAPKLSTVIKRFFKENYKMVVRVNTGVSKNPFIDAWIQSTGDPRKMGPIQYPYLMPVEVRNAALDVVYGNRFEWNREAPSAGNVSGGSIALHAGEWMKVMEMVKG